jgi:PhnB protein
MMLSLLGAAGQPILAEWSRRLAEGGRVIDRYGLHWLIGFEADEGR